MNHSGLSTRITALPIQAASQTAATRMPIPTQTSVTTMDGMASCLTRLLTKWAMSRPRRRPLW